MTTKANHVIVYQNIKNYLQFAQIDRDNHRDNSPVSHLDNKISIQILSESIWVHQWRIQNHNGTLPPVQTFGRVKIDSLIQISKTVLE
jgi:hypothetical protein